MALGLPFLGQLHHRFPASDIPAGTTVTIFT